MIMAGQTYAVGTVYLRKAKFLKSRAFRNPKEIKFLEGFPGVQESQVSATVSQHRRNFEYVFVPVFCEKLNLSCPANEKMKTSPEFESRQAISGRTACSTAQSILVGCRSRRASLRALSGLLSRASCICPAVCLCPLILFPGCRTWDNS